MGRLAVLSVLSYALATTTAHAYIDPGTGSIVTTAILGAIAAVTFTFRKYMYKLRRLVFGSSAERDGQPSDKD
jgi:hypothetical protein